LFVGYVFVGYIRDYHFCKSKILLTLSSVDSSFFKSIHWSCSSLDMVQCCAVG